MSTQKFYLDRKTDPECKALLETHETNVAAMYEEWLKLNLAGEAICPDLSEKETIKIFGQLEDAKLMAHVRGKMAM